MSTRLPFRSMPTTTPPCRRTNCATSWPTRPSPITATTSPSSMRAVRTAFIAMLPSVAKQACSHGHAFGHARRQIAAHQNGLAVARAFAAISHALADFEIGHGGVARRHHAGA